MHRPPPMHSHMALALKMGGASNRFESPHPRRRREPPASRWRDWLSLDAHRRAVRATASANRHGWRPLPTAPRPSPRQGTRLFVSPPTIEHFPRPFFCCSHSRFPPDSMSTHDVGQSERRNSTCHPHPMLLLLTFDKPGHLGAAVMRQDEADARESRTLPICHTPIR